MENSKKPVQLVEAGEGKALSIVGDSYRIVISGKETAGAYAVIDMLIPPGGGPGPHSHPAFQETFHVLEGEVELISELGTVTAREGSFVNIPTGGIVHGFKNKTNEMARLWCVVVPAGLESFFEEIGEPSTFGTFIEPPPMTKELGMKLAETAKKYGQQVFPPDYLDKKK